MLAEQTARGIDLQFSNQHFITAGARVRYQGSHTTDREVRHASRHAKRLMNTGVRPIGRSSPELSGFRISNARSIKFP